MQATDLSINISVYNVVKPLDGEPNFVLHKHKWMRKIISEIN